MSGAWHVYPGGSRWRRPAASAWLVLSADEVDAAQFGGPTLRLLDAGRLRRDPILGRLGPDILGEGFSDEEGVGSLRRAESDRELGDALLDQRLIAGIGNS